MIELIEFTDYLKIHGSLGAIGFFSFLNGLLNFRKSVLDLANEIESKRIMDEDSGIRKAFNPKIEKALFDAKKIESTIRKIRNCSIASIAFVLIYLIGNNIDKLSDHFLYFLFLIVINYFSIIIPFVLIIIYSIKMYTVKNRLISIANNKIY